MIITIDGAAGTGKSTVAKLLAKKIGFVYLDTGAMYRACALWGLRCQVDWSKPEQLAKAVEQIPLRLENRNSTQRIFLGSDDVTETVRSASVTAITKYAADNKAVREMMVERQKSLGKFNLIAEGRDQGTVVFPNAELKVFLTAEPETCAKRRYAQMLEKANAENGASNQKTITYDEVLESILTRDKEDQTRTIGTLKPACEAIIVPTDEMNINQVVDKLYALYSAIA